MVPLKTNRRVLTWLCVYPDDESANKRWKLAYIIFSCVVLETSLFSIGASVAFLLNYGAVDAEQSLFAFVQIVGIMSMVYVTVITHFQRHRITALFDDLTEFYGMRKNYIIKFNEFRIES